MTKTVERTAIADCSLDGEPVKVGQVLTLNRKQFTRLVAAGCIHEDAEENETVPKLSLAGEIGTAIGEAQDGAAIEAGNAAHTGSAGYADSHSALADAARVAAERERREIEARDAAEDARRAAERQRQEDARIAADAKAKAEAEARVKAEKEAKAKADAEAKLKAEADAKAKAEAEAKAKAAQTPPGATV